ncbi:MAG: NYN domain-containing protein [Dialister sp.]|nr:NYN domain-containing protein [Dialister sp.]
MRDLYFIDGYNIIFSMPDEFDSNEMESARKKLVEQLQDFGAHNDIEIIVVFDGQGKTKKPEVEQISPRFAVVFTPARMTADTYIESESYRRRDEYRSIFVATSDGAEQSVALGNGAYRLAAADLKRMLIRDKENQATFITAHNRANLRSEIGMNLPDEVQEKLDRLRK